jgi:serine/threonine protein kinase
MDPGSQQGARELQAEVDILSRVHHPHVLLLLGACTEPGHQALVYERMEGGSLEEALGLGPPGQGQGNAAGAGQRRALPWHDRVRIAAEVAAALVHLHTGPSPIIHMDVKPANILLGR